MTNPFKMSSYELHDKVLKICGFSALTFFWLLVVAMAGGSGGKIFGTLFFGSLGIAFMGLPLLCIIGTFRHIIDGTEPPKRFRRQVSEPKLKL